MASKYRARATTAKPNRRKTFASTTASASALTTTFQSLPVSDDASDKNFESFTLVWLDMNVNKTEKNIQTQQLLRAAVNYIKTFDNLKICQEWLQQRQTNNEKIILIVSGSYGRDLVPQIHGSPWLSAVYVHCSDKSDNEKWANNYKKVCAVTTNSDELVSKILADQKEREKLVELTSMPMTVYSTSSSTVSPGEQSSSSKLNGDFLWFQLLIEVFLRMRHPISHRKELIEQCKLTHAGNKYELNLIREFELNYSLEKAVWWYTRETCLYKMLNKALRTQDIDTLISFRFFIRDLYLYLKEIHAQKDRPVIHRVYRAQLMSTDELRGVRHSTGNFVSMNSFLSTTLDRKIALGFLAKGSLISADLHRVLFEIDIDESLNNIKPYADISSRSYFQEEAEVLLMLGSIFKIQSAKTEDDIWVIKLQLASEDDSGLKQLSDYLKENLDKQPDLISLGHILKDMGEYEKARKYYQRQLDETVDKTSAEASRCYKGLGIVAHETGKYDLAIKFHGKAVRIDKSLSHNDNNVSVCYNNLANAYKRTSDYRTALEYYNKSLKINKDIHGHDSLEVADSYYNIGNTYLSQMRSNDALNYFQQALEIREKRLPENHYEIGQTLTNMGITYHQMDKPQIALEYYIKAREIFRHSLPSTHPDVVANRQHIKRLQRE